MTKSKFKVGDRVSISRRGYAESIKTVKRVMARFVELDDGSKWSHSGSVYPHVPWSFIHMRLATDQDVADVGRHRLLSKIEPFGGWRKLTTDQLIRVMAIISEKKDP